MSDFVNRLAVVVAGSVAPLAAVTLVSPGVSSATECGVGTVYDAPSNSCIVAAPPPPLPPPPPPPPPLPPNGDLTPYFSVGICAPIPFVSLCTGI